MDQTQNTCIIDVDKNVIRCQERDGTWKSYEIGNPTLSKNSMKIKKKKMDDLAKIGKNCYGSNKCVDPVTLTVFKIDSCPACKSHEKVLSNIEKIFSDAKVPVRIVEKDARKNIDEFEAIGCNGTPCTSIQVGNKDRIKLYEGNKGEIGVISDVLGVPNPLYYDVNIEGMEPRRLVKSCNDQR